MEKEGCVGEKGGGVKDWEREDFSRLMCGREKALRLFRRACLSGLVVECGPLLVADGAAQVGDAVGTVGGGLAAENWLAVGCF